MLTVWGRKTSSNVQALMWLIAELGLAYKRHDVGHRYGGTDTADFLAMNPNGLVPVLRDGDEAPIWETGAILRYLAGRYAAPPFWPEEGSSRAAVDKWAEWSKVNVATNFTGPIFWRVARTVPSQRDPSAIHEAVVKLGNFLDIADARLARQDFLACDDFTLADIQFGHILFRYFDIDIERQDRPALQRYYDRLRQRPPFAEHVMVSYDELRVTDE
jgi:glutathione S-transferase